jgi:hypothetical protein
MRSRAEGAALRATLTRRSPLQSCCGSSRKKGVRRMIVQYSLVKEYCEPMGGMLKRHYEKDLTRYRGAADQAERGFE